MAPLTTTCEDCGGEFYVFSPDDPASVPTKCGSCQHQTWELETLYGKHSGSDSEKETQG
jgi:hypothetical protein